MWRLPVVYSKDQTWEDMAAKGFAVLTEFLDSDCSLKNI